MNNLSPLKRRIVIGVPVVMSLLILVWIAAAFIPGMFVVAQLYSLLLLTGATVGIIGAWIAGLHWSYREVTKDQDWAVIFLFLWIMIPGFMVVAIFMGMTYALAMVTLS